MSKRIGWLITATVLIVTGCILFVGVMSKMSWDLTDGRYETNTHTVTDGFTDISIDTTTADIIFAPSESDTVSVVCYEEVNVKHRVSVEGGVLVIEEVDTRTWYQHIDIFSGKPKLTVYLPKGDYGSLMLKVTTGDVTIPDGYSFATAAVQVTTGDITCSAAVTETATVKSTTGDVTLSSMICGDVTVGVSTGKITLTDMTCRDLTTTGTTGDVVLRNVMGSGTFIIKRGTGDVTFDACDAAALTVNTTTGDIIGTLLSSKTFEAHTTTGRVSVPSGADGGKCELTTTTGDIRITLL